MNRIDGKSCGCGAADGRIGESRYYLSFAAVPVATSSSMPLPPPLISL